MSVTILVVEDEPAIQELISYNLKRNGHMVLCADDAEQAMEMLNNVLPDLILLDWMLLNMSGVEFARILRREPRTKLLDRVWGDHVFIEDRTVDVHIRRLRKVLENVGKDALVQTVRGGGYRFSVEYE